MVHILLIGAGFSRNWNGWLADELRAKLLARLADNQELHRIASSCASFEEAFSRVQREFKGTGSAQSKANLDSMQAAVMKTFRAMNESFARRPTMEFSNERYFSIRDFLNRFDAIFSLNQDLLLELHYGHLELAEPRRWNGCCFPGMQVPAGWGATVGQLARNRRDMIWQPGAELRVEEGSQPIYKLHGSVNWKEGDTDLLVLGGEKAGAIAGTRLLRWYSDEFRRYLGAGGTHLMVIGYGFCDDHINRMLHEAYTKSGLRMFLVGPTGSRVLNRQPAAQIRVRDPLEEIPIIGESVRPLTTTFNGDDLEHDELLRFFG